MPHNWDKTKEAAAYRNQYIKEHYDRLYVACPKGWVQEVDAAAKSAGMSRAAFVIEAVEEKIKKVK